MRARREERQSEERGAPHHVFSSATHGVTRDLGKMEDCNFEAMKNVRGIGDGGTTGQAWMAAGPTEILSISPRCRGAKGRGRTRGVRRIRTHQPY